MSQIVDTLTSEEQQLLNVPFSSLVQDQTVLHMALSAWDKRNTISRNLNATFDDTAWRKDILGAIDFSQKKKKA